jgi:hypothetical protein
MNELNIACLAGLAVWCTGLSLVYLKMTIKQTKVEIALLMISKRAAEFLHHTDDRYKLDHLVDKYRDRCHDLSHAEWEELLRKASAIADDKNVSKDERLAAGLLHDLSRLVKELSIHKLTRRFQTERFVNLLS